MAAFRDAVAAIEGRMQAHWALSPVAYENTGAYNVEPAQDYVVCQVREGGANLVGLPAAHPASVRVTGVITVLIHIARGRGAQRAREFCDAVAAIFNPLAPFDGITCRAGYPTPSGQDGTHWIMRYTVPFFFSSSP